MKNVIGIYHSQDLDGYCSGAIVKYKYPDAILIPYNYGELLEIDFKDKNIIICDVSLSMSKMQEIAEQAQSLTWIDHHVSAINDYEKFKADNEVSFLAVLENGISACEGTWKHLFNKNIPFSVKLLSDYDVWNKKDINRWNHQILPFQYGMRVKCNSPETFDSDLFTDDDKVFEIIKNGTLILDYQKQVDNTTMRSSFACEFENLKAICCNTSSFSSTIFDSVYDEAKYDIMIPFQFNGTKWKFSVYTTKLDIDCSSIAKKYGGGGHRQASGFEVDDIKEIFK